MFGRQSQVAVPPHARWGSDGCPAIFGNCVTSLLFNLIQISRDDWIHLIPLLKSADLLRTSIGWRVQYVRSLISNWEYFDPISTFFL